MTRTVLFNCPIKAEIRAVDGQSDLRIIFVIVMIRKEMLFEARKSNCIENNEN